MVLHRAVGLVHCGYYHIDEAGNRVGKMNFLPQGGGPEGTRPLRRKSFGSYQLLTSPPNVGKNGQKRYFRPYLGGTSVLTVPQNPQRISAVVY
jgi:hypothetical protein